MSRARSVFGWFVAASLLAHALWLLVLPAAHPRPSAFAHSNVEFSLVSEPATMPATAAARERDRSRRTPTQARPKTRTKSAAIDPPTAPPSAAEELRSHEPSGSSPELAAQRAPLDQAGPALPAPSPPQPPAAGLTPSAAGAKPPDLSARAAALTTRDLDAAPSNLCNPRASATAACVGAPTEASRNDELTQSLQTAARNVPHLTPREPPQLQRQADGSYRYEGHVFQAHVGLDGEVAFDDAAQLHANTIPISGGFDLYDAIEKHVLKKELYSAEKTWFLEQTAALREELSTKFRASEISRTKRALERELERVFSADSSLDQKHTAIFALWENCGEDAEAADVRVLVEDFVRRRLPRGSSLAFGEDELRRVNRERNGMRAFDPYKT
jgi:hypothetical protein